MTEKNSALVYDFGLNVEMALKLCEVYDKVYYYCEWRDAFPKADKALIGTGFEDEGLVRINEFWEYVDYVDAIYFFDTYTGDIAEYLKRKGYNVFGGGNAEMLENDRWFGRQLQKKVGLPAQRTVKIKGVSNLRQYLQDNDDVVVKINMFRGDLESFYSKNYEASKTILDYYASVLGLRQELVEFIVEDYLPGIEPGTDLYIVDGKYPNYGLFAYEMKGAGYAAKVMKYEDIPEQVRLVNDKLAVFFEKLKARTLFSTEVRIDERDKKGYLIDSTVRCFDDKTEILTEKGWKFFKDLDKTEKVATLNTETNEIEYHKPYAYQKYFYKGEMYHFYSQNKSIDLLVTPDHTLWGYASTHEKNKRIWSKLKPFIVSNIPYRLRIPKTGIWKGKKIEYFILPEYKKEWISGKGKGIYKVFHKPDLAINMKSWLKFFGLYLAEGSCNRCICNIAQSLNSKRRGEIEKILNELPFKWTVQKSGAYQISSIQLVSYLKQFGKCNQKYVPNFIKELTPELIKDFLYGYWLGDGSSKDGRSLTYYTTSEQLANDIQELVFKSGEAGNIKIMKTKGSKMKVRNDKEYIRNYDIYRIITRPTKKVFYYEKSQNYIKKEHYEGYVYDVTVKNHVIYVRRNGIPIWSGNCGLPVPTSVEMEIYENFAEAIKEAAHGNLIELEPRWQYGVGVALDSDWAEEHWLNVQFPEGLRQFIKFRRVMKYDNQFYAVPGFSSVCSVLGFGDTLDDAIEMCKKNIEQVQAFGLQKNFSGLIAIKEEIEKAKKEYNIDF